MSAPGPFRLDGQAAIVTGASSGLGAIIADGLAEAGCAVVMAARREQALERAAEAIDAGGGRADARGADLRDPGHAEDLVSTALAAFGRLDGVVLNAGASTIAAAAEEDLAAFADVLAVNVTAQAALAAAAARQMIDAGGGGWMIARARSSAAGPAPAPASPPTAPPRGRSSSSSASSRASGRPTGSGSTASRPASSPPP